MVGGIQANTKQNSGRDPQEKKLLTRAQPPIASPLFKHIDSLPFNQSFNCRSALGIPQCIGNNTHPECAHAINACAHCCVSPRQAHGNVLKKIGRCLKGVLDDGLIIDPKGDLSLDSHVNADFAGNCNAKEVDDRATVRSRTGFVITLGSVPVLWKSVVQTEIVLSTVEAECIAPSTAMRKLIQLQTVLFEIKDTFGLKISNNLSTTSAGFEDNWACGILATTDLPCMTPRLKSLAIKHHWF